MDFNEKIKKKYVGLKSMSEILLDFCLNHLNFSQMNFTELSQSGENRKNGMVTRDILHLITDIFPDLVVKN